MTDKQNFEKDIDVPSKRLDRIDKMEIDLANYERMERDIEKIIEPYQLDWELDCLSLPSAIQSILERKEQECETLASQLDFEVQKKECLEQECEEMRIYIESNEQQVKEVETLVMDNDRLINELDQLKEQLEAYKMEAEEGKEINAELKAENEEWKKANGCILTTLNVIAEGNKKLRQTLTEIKEIAENREIFCENCGGGVESFTCDDCGYVKILQKISECEGNNEF